MPNNEKPGPKADQTDKIYIPKSKIKPEKTVEPEKEDDLDLLNEMEAGLSTIEEEYPALAAKSDISENRTNDLKAILEISQAINSSLVLDDILDKVMIHAIKLLQAERGFIMLLNEDGKLQFKTAHNIVSDRLQEDDFKISNSIANEVAQTGVSVFTSDAQADERYSKQKSIAELKLRSIMCVPLEIKEKIIGVVYLDNSSEAKIFLQSDLFLFELFAAQAAIAIENAKMYENLLSLKKYNESVINKTPVGIVVTDDKFNITSINDTAFMILAPPEKDTIGHRKSILGTSFLDMIIADQAPYWKHTLNLAIDKQRTIENPKYYYRSEEQKEKVLNLKVSPLENKITETNGLIITIEDITEKAILENYVMLSEKLVAKGEMAASIGHELNNYLTIISSSAELLERNVESRDFTKIKNNTAAIFDNISKIKRFTDSLMDFSRMEKEVVSYNLRKLIDDLLFSIKPHKKFQDITFEIKIPHDFPEVQIDVGQIQQVLLNIIYNARDAIKSIPDREGKIVISAQVSKSDPQLYTVKLTDNGPGVAPENLDKIFEHGFTTKPDGHGLGLSNCRRIIESHSGKIKINSTPGNETTFTIILPFKQT